MHAADPSRSQRLKRALEYVRSAGPRGCTTMEVQAFTGSMAPATDFSELRQSGYLIDCQRDGTTQAGRKVYRYHYRGRTYTP